MGSTSAPKVSVILTTFNRASVLGQTIEDILNQTFSDFELLIADDCSSDDTRDVCAGYAKQDKRIRYQRNQVNRGMPDNLNLAIQASVGEYVANLHDGDKYDQTLLEKWKEALDRAPNAAFVFNQYRVICAGESSERIYAESLPAV